MMINFFHVQRLRKLKYLSLCLYILLIIGLSLSQDASDVRILTATSYADSGVAIHVEIPEGQRIDQVNINLPDGARLSLDVDADPVAVDNWLVLDAGAGAVDSGAVFQSAQESFAGTISAPHSLNVMILDDDVRIFRAIENQGDLLDVLKTYNPRMDSTVCFSEALNRLSAEESQAVQRILLLTGDKTDNCDSSIHFVAPLDVIQISSEPDKHFSNLTGGDSIQSSIQSVRSDIQMMLSNWQNPVYRVQGFTGQAVDNATIELRLSNGEEFVLDTQFEQQTMPTLAPTDAEIITVSSEPSSPATESPTLDVTEQVVIPSVAPSHTEIVPSNTPELSATATPVPAQTVETPETNNNLLLIVGFVGIVLAVLVFLAVFMNRNRKQVLDRTESPPDSFTEEQMEKTTMLDDSQSPLDRTESVSLEEVEASAKSTLIGYLHHRETGTSYKVNAPQTILGREEGVGILIEGDKQISRQHLRFVLWPDKTIWVTRLTRNPVLLNEKPIEKHEQIKSGDVLQVSTNLRLRFQEVKSDED